MSHQTLPKANDAIPADGIKLTEAFRITCRHLQLLYPDFPGSDRPVILGLSEDAKAKERERQKGLGGHLEDHLFYIDCNMFFRDRLRIGELVACVRDPVTGDILRLNSVGWFPERWLMPDAVIPPGISHDHVHPDDPDTPGPEGTFLHGALRPVFFYFDQFEEWLTQTFKEPPGRPASVTSSITSAHRRTAVKQAIASLWGEAGPGPGVSERLRERKINQWLKEHDRAMVSDATIRRALRELRVTASDRS